ncbi:ribonuclease P protein component [Aeromicrobium sp. YIM 150415]|uniref:ribonuclease P protein component n=1 Tax=Aeromicrobium sp. YIM 150415 TaxID=2803912 RepID=UPI0019646E41|nr:ribonuclease P protein component [Aeromicrobium sp. YIM 150415]MBM9463855.1 ribonuclease P protein component [Aeromicrobium sp. YIM 150415]
MLARAHRMRDGDTFRHVIRRGRKGATPALVVHAMAPTEPTDSSVGFVVSKAVGGAVQRNQVKRRLRHLMRERVSEFGEPQWVVVRALRPAAEASSAELGEHLDRALARIAERKPR